MEEPLREGFSDLLRQLDEWTSLPPYVTEDGREISRVTGMPPLPGAIGRAASAANAVRLEKQLAQAQMGEAGMILAGPGGRVVFRDAQRVAQQYGGTAADWVKKSSSSYLSRDGTRFEIHWVENISTGQRVEFKTKFPGGE